MKYIYLFLILLFGSGHSYSQKGMPNSQYGDSYVKSGIFWLEHPLPNGWNGLNNSNGLVSFEKSMAKDKTFSVYYFNTNQMVVYNENGKKIRTEGMDNTSYSIAIHTKNIKTIYPSKWKLITDANKINSNDENKYNFINSDQTKLINKTNFVYANKFSEGLAAVTIDNNIKAKSLNKYKDTGFINQKGEMVIPPVYTGAEVAVNTKHKKVLRSEYEYKFVNGYAVVNQVTGFKSLVAFPDILPYGYKTEVKSMIIDTTGKEVCQIPSKFFEYYFFSKGLLMGGEIEEIKRKNRIDNYITVNSLSGKELLRFEYNPFHEYWNEFDKLSRPVIFDGDPDDEVILIVHNKQKKAWVWEGGEKIREIPYQFYRTGFHDGMAMVLNEDDLGHRKTACPYDGGIGYANLEGRLTVPVGYCKGYNFSKGKTLVVSNEGEIYLIDKEGNRVQDTDLNK